MLAATAVFATAAPGSAADPLRAFVIDPTLTVSLPADFEGALEPHPGAAGFLRATDGTDALTIAVLKANGNAAKRRANAIEAFVRGFGDAFGRRFAMTRHEVDLAIGKQRVRGVRLDISGLDRAWTAWIGTIDIRRRTIVVTHVAPGVRTEAPNLAGRIVFK